MGCGCRILGVGGVVVGGGGGVGGMGMQHKVENWAAIEGRIWVGGPAAHSDAG